MADRPNGPRPTRGRVIVFGILFWYPLAGVTYQFLHYLIGLRRLGYDVFYVEDSGRWVYDPALNDLSPDAGANVAAVAPVLEAHGFAGRWAFRGSYPGGRCYGMEEADLARLYGDADAFLNVTGAQELRDEHMSIPRRVYVESDPFGSQVKASQGDAETLDALSRHDAHFTFGENIGREDCDIPATPFDWKPTRQPVVTGLWSTSGTAGRRGDAAYNTITTWRNKGKDVTYRGGTYYWTKDREFEKFIDLPRRCRRVPFELAVGADPEGARRLRDHGWRLSDSARVSADPLAYREYIRGSRGEFTVARDQYVRPRTGWFSDRTACYLAAGRPAVTQETGFSKFLPSGRGLFGFSTTDEAVAAVEAIESDWAGHSRAAREIAEEYFEATKVLASLMERAGL